MKCNFFFALPVLCQLLCAGASYAQCNTVNKNPTASPPSFHYNLLPNPCTNNWRTPAAVYPVETYTICWVTNDGSFYRTDAGTGTSLPNTDVSFSTLMGKDLLFTGVANRKGDDNDPKKLAGSYNGASGNSSAGYNTFSNTQNNLPGSTITQIQNDYGSDLIAKTDEVLLIFTINNDDSISGTPLLPLSGYHLRLWHSNTSVVYAHDEGEIPNTYPIGDDKYFEFAKHPAGSIPAPVPAISNPLQTWEMVTPPSGKEKNIYCLLRITSVPACNDERRVIDTFSIELTNIATGQMVAGSRSQYVARIGTSHDPNMIEVNHDVSNICGKKQEELQYTIHFQNIGSGNANTVTINLEADPALDPSTIVVTDAGIGYSHMTSTPTLSQNVNTNLTSSNCSFVYTTQPRNNPPNTVGNDATFKFSNATLEGINAADIELSKGYVTFTVKTAHAYLSIHNRAGIVFDNNPEIVTNLAVTTCGESDVDCAVQLDQCHQQLQQCENNCHNWMYWLGWIIAAAEFLLLIFLFTRRKK